MKPDKGEIWVDNKMINNLRFKELQKIRAKIGGLDYGFNFDHCKTLRNGEKYIHKRRVK